MLSAMLPDDFGEAAFGLIVGSAVVITAQQITKRGNVKERFGKMKTQTEEKIAAMKLMREMSKNAEQTEPKTATASA